MLKTSRISRVGIKANVYHVTAEILLDIERKQDGKCAICGKETLYPHIDHNHGTGWVRALLCNACNVTVGKYEKGHRIKSIDTVNKIKAYLEAYDQ